MDQGNHQERLDMKIRPQKKKGDVVVELSARDEVLLEGSQKTPSRINPFQLQKILVPIDFSDCSKKALQYAIAFAEFFDASITLLHVVQVSLPGTEFAAIDFHTLESQLVENSDAALEKLVREEIRDRVPTQAITRVGQPVREAVRAAQELGVDLIIISTHGHTGLKHVFLGSTTEHLVRYAPCPILTVREHEHEFIGA
jgi:universal stress protein A